ncbi:MAG: ABC transporter permease [Gemmataceae bacterium]
MMRILGVLGLLVMLYAGLIGTYVENAPAGEPSARTQARIQDNLVDVANEQGRYGVITLGAALVIIAGGIDLSIGAVVGCSAVLFGYLMEEGVHPFFAVPIVLLFGAAVGLGNGLLITRLKLQPFLVTLCGMFVYRGLARLIAGQVSRAKSLEVHPEFANALQSLRYLLVGKNAQSELVFPAEFIVLIVLAIAVGFFLHRTAYGRYWYAVGHNEQAARYAGVNVNRHRVSVYVICSLFASLAGVLLFLDMPSIQSDSGGMYLELYAILGAVLGGCSLRGGEGTVPGMVLGAMVLPILQSLVSIRGLESNVIPAVIGLTLLVGTIVDEFIRRRSRLHK